MNKVIFSLLPFILFATVLYSQEDATNLDNLFEELKIKDSLIFNVGFNHCDTAQLRALLSDDLEFYHDKDGLLESKERLLQGIPNLCRMSYKPTRVLMDSTLQLYPLYKEGKLYGAIQTGVHQFYGEEKDKPKYLTSTAKFTHVWIIEDERWKLKRILSYDHVIPNQ